MFIVHCVYSLYSFLIFFILYYSCISIPSLFPLPSSFLLFPLLIPSLSAGMVWRFYWWPRNIIHSLLSLISSLYSSSAPLYFSHSISVLSCSATAYFLFLRYFSLSPSLPLFSGIHWRSESSLILSTPSNSLYRLIIPLLHSFSSCRCVLKILITVSTLSTPS